MNLDVWNCVILGSLTIFLYLLQRVLYKIWYNNRYIENSSSSSKEIKTLIVLGSGGHTSEMFKLCSSLNRRRFTPRTYIVAETDNNSMDRLKEKDPSGILVKVPRSRNVGQSYFSSIFSTLTALKSSLGVLLKVRPELLLANGPGTCLPVCLVGWAYKKVGFLSSRTKIVFVESVCRVETLSLSAKLLTPFVDHVLVQWPEMADKFPNTTYIDRFI